MPVWPKRKNTVRNDYTFPRHFLGGPWMQRRFNSGFNSLTFRFNSPHGLFDYPWAYKEDSPLSRESQQRPPPPTMRIPPDSKAQRHRSLPHPDLRCCETPLQIHGTLFLPMRASLDPLSLEKSSSSRYDQAVQRLSTTMKMVAKGILKDHLVPVASIPTCSGSWNGFNNVGYKATFRPLKVQIPLTESTLFTPMKCMRRLQRDAILILGMCGLIMFMGQACSYLLRILERKSAKKQQGVWWWPIWFPGLGENRPRKG
jgi:hypothetical protein